MTKAALFAIALAAIPTISTAQTVQSVCQQFGELGKNQVMLNLSEIMVVSNYANLIAAQHPEAAELAEKMKEDYEAMVSERIKAYTEGSEVILSNCQ